MFVNELRDILNRLPGTTKFVIYDESRDIYKREMEIVKISFPDNILPYLIIKTIPCHDARIHDGK